MFRNVVFLYLTIVFSSCSDKFDAEEEIRTNCKQGSEPVNKVLFIGWDGVRSDAVQTAETPNLDVLIASSLFSYNCDRGPYTVSVPGWSSILHGVWPEKHNLFENTFKKNNYEEYPDIISIAKQFKPNLSATILTSWDDFLRITDNEDYAQRYDNDKQVTDASIQLLSDCTPDLMFLHFDYTDHVGHKIGFSNDGIEYLSAIEISDFYLGQIMSQVYLRENLYGEKWMVVLTTDHGGEGTGHGGQDDLPQTRNVWAVIRTPNQEITELQSIKSVDLLPTMLKWLGIDNVPNLDGTALN